MGVCAGISAPRSRRCGRHKIRGAEGAQGGPPAAALNGRKRGKSVPRRAVPPARASPGRQPVLPDPGGKRQGKIT
ncbi:hypothetical protein HMPREF3293_02966 [Christensenella minuta]|uniref:Uncharacterized protein n=1 Tax=Christensenella minuta TaxID=626937 RepID=A0A136Q0U9_9FIRM|nr:hypothetical protein HMPREF3293_02966 [Christensenella minuta]